MKLTHPNNEGFLLRGRRMRYATDIKHKLNSTIKHERDLWRYLNEYWKLIFPGAYRLVGFNVPLHGCITGRKIGYIDLIFSIGKKTYFVEIKFNNWNSGYAEDFWSSLKVLGYVKSQKGAYPAIMIREKAINHDYLAILGALNLSYITFDIKDDYITFKFNIIKHY
jgi:hypothetical protein